jgi:hypothetical protein
MRSTYYIVRSGVRSPAMSLEQLHRLARKRRVRASDEILLERGSVITSLGEAALQDWFSTAQSLEAGPARIGASQPRTPHPHRGIWIALAPLIAATPFVLAIPMIVKGCKRAELNESIRGAIAQFDRRSGQLPANVVAEADLLLGRISSIDSGSLDGDVQDSVFRIRSAKEAAVKAIAERLQQEANRKAEVAMTLREAADRRARQDAEARALAARARAEEEARLEAERAEAQKRAEQLAWQNKRFTIQGTVIAKFGLNAASPLRGIRVLLLPDQIPVARRNEIFAKICLRVDRTLHLTDPREALDDTEAMSLGSISERLRSSAENFRTAFDKARGKPSTHQDLILIMQALESCATAIRDRRFAAIKRDGREQMTRWKVFGAALAAQLSPACEQANIEFLSECIMGGDATLNPDNLLEVLDMLALSQTKSDQNGAYMFSQVPRGDYLLFAPDIFASMFVALARPLKVDDLSSKLADLTDDCVCSRIAADGAKSARELLDKLWAP